MVRVGGYVRRMLEGSAGSVLIVFLGLLGVILVGNNLRTSHGRQHPASRSPLPAVESAGGPRSGQPSEPEGGEGESDLKLMAHEYLKPTIRRFNRKSEAFSRSESVYLERLHLWTLTYALLQLGQSTPGTFAGDLPERDANAYEDYVEASEALLLELTVYINRYADLADADYAQLLDLHKQALAGATSANPKSGSRLQDAIDAMETRDYRKIAAESDPRIAQLFSRGVPDITNTIGDALRALGKALK